MAFGDKEVSSTYGIRCMASVCQLERLERQRKPVLRTIRFACTGGFYTQDEMRDLIDYARKRSVIIVPEIEMPSHSGEVLTAYPELSCTHELYKQRDFCVGNEKTFEFIENVLDEVIALFPRNIFI